VYEDSLQAIKLGETGAKWLIVNGQLRIANLSFSKDHRIRSIVGAIVNGELTIGN